MARNTDLVQTKCPHCGHVQKADGRKYDAVCKKCNEVYVVEEGIDCLVAVDLPKPVAVDDDYDTLFEKGRGSLEAGDYGLAREFLTAAVGKRPESAPALWLLCRAVMCVPEIDPPKSLVLYARGEKAQAIEAYVAERGIPAARAEFEINRLLDEMKCFTDEESDEIFEAACAYADTDFREKISDRYAVYSCKTSTEEDAVRAQEAFEKEGRLPDLIAEIPPSFGKRRLLFDWRTVMVLILGFLAVAGSIVLIALDLYDGWTIALLVIGVFVALIGIVALYMDLRKADLHRYVLKYNPTDVDQVVYALYKVTDEMSLARARINVLNSVRTMIQASQLTNIGVTGGSKFVYYNDEGEAYPDADESESEQKTEPKDEEGTQNG